MAKKRKLTTLELPEETEIVQNTSEVVTFSVFFHSSLVKGLVKSWQFNELLAYVKDLGLSEKESEDRYADAFAKY